METIVSVPLGATDNRVIGKTGEPEVTLPVDLVTGLINYALIKEVLAGGTTGNNNKLTLPNNSFFVDTDGRPLSLEQARSNRTGEEMAREIGISRLPTFTEQRRVVASKIISAGATGNTGMGHMPAVQRIIYDDLQREQGVANKRLANKSLLEKPVDTETVAESSDSSYGQTWPTSVDWMPQPPWLSSETIPKKSFSSNFFH